MSNPFSSSSIGSSSRNRRGSTMRSSGVRGLNSSVGDSSSDEDEAPPGGSRRGRGSSSQRSGRSSSSNEQASSSQQQTPQHVQQLYESLPDEYRFNPKTVEPMLHFLPKAVADHAAENTATSSTSSSTSSLAGHRLLHGLLKAADSDARLHRARVRAGIEQDLRLIRTYQLEHDPAYRERRRRLEERNEIVRELLSESSQIMKELLDDGVDAATRGLTQAERTQVQLARWQRALELYVYSPQQSQQQQQHQQQEMITTQQQQLNRDNDLDWQSLFEKLLSGVSEDAQDISQILAEAANMCSSLVDATRQSVRDAADFVLDIESGYVLRLEAHQLFARECLKEVGGIEEQFKTSGRAALQIGHQLELAELKRSQCESAGILIRRWWLLENLAEQEATSGESLRVEEEVLGLTPLSECMMDPLFTKPENSLEASRALKQLRAVVRSRGNAAAAGANAAAAAAAASAAEGGGGGDKASMRRFDLTARLIARTSDALEERLLNSFSDLYTTGGIYDFSQKPRPGAIDWRELRALAQALLLFDSGRNLHKRYVDMVVSSRFPELFQQQENQEGSNNGTNEGSEHADASESSGAGDKFDMDSTRSKLSNLFHRVSEVCTAEFELIAHVFGLEGSASSSSVSRTDLLDGSEEMPLVVARALLQRVISDPKHGLQARINDLLGSIDRMGDFDAGAKKLDTFVVIHEKAAGLFGLLKDAAERMVPDCGEDGGGADPSSTAGEGGGIHAASPQLAAARNAVESLKGFLTSQELALSNTHRQGYINLELRLLHHDCCSGLDQAGCTLVKGPPSRPDRSLAEKGILEEYRAPILPLYKEFLKRSGFTGILAGPLKQSVLRQPLIHATDSLARARLMFGTSKRGGETTSRVILAIYGQMCSFYGEGFLYPIVETIHDMLPTSPPAQPPQLPFDEELEAPDLGVSPAFWVALERVHSAAKSFDRELWAENRVGSQRVWETLEQCGDASSIATARDGRGLFYSDLERRGDAAILRALNTLSTHIQWVLVTGGESMMATGGTRIFNQLTGQSGGPYAIPTGSSLETPNSPAVKSLTYCLRVQFVHVQAALTAQSLASFWTALSMRLYDILVARLLLSYQVSTVGAVILSRDVEALRSVAMLAGKEHAHWDALRELLTLYMTPPDAIKTMLIGPDGDSSKGLFAKAGREQCLVFLSRRQDYRYKSAAGLKKSNWIQDLLTELSLSDPSDGGINIGLFAAGRNT